MKIPRTGLATPAEVAAHLGVTEKRLTQWRYLRVGPAFTKVGRSVRYDWREIDRYVTEQTVQVVRAG